MKFCQKCGKEIVDEAVICPGCGCAVARITQKSIRSGGNDGLAVASKVFLILGCIVQGWLLIPLAWCLPITISICNKMKNDESIGLGLKICSLLFVNMAAGILLLCISLYVTK